jgi:glycosyltransferase involved in cell wall biosynthesis
VIFCATNGDPFQKSADDMRKAGITVLGNQDELRKYLDEESDFVKLAIVSRARTAHAVYNWLNQVHPEIPLVFDTVDLHHVREFELAQLENSEAGKLRAMATQRIELFLVEKTVTTIVVSNNEKKYLESFCPDSKIAVIGTIHRVPQEIGPFDERQGLLFVGNFQHEPNEDGLRWFFEDVWNYIDPAIKKSGLNVIGNRPSQQLVDMAPAEVKFLGWVESTDSYVDKARLSVAPLRYGAGIKGKVSEAWSRGLPVIGTSSAFRGMLEAGDADFPLADEPQKFAELINSVYSSEALWDKSSAAGIRRVKETWSPDVAKSVLNDLIAFVDI